MSSSPPALPTPRQLLTSVLNQISQIPAPTAPGPGSAPAQNSGTITRTDSFPERAREPPANPLRLLDARHRPLFTTLHVLFPSLLLPALDLLDRGLVTRLLGPGEEVADTAFPAEGRPPAHRDEGPHEAEREDGGGSPQARDSTAAPSSSSSVYLVRSAQKPTRRPYGGGDAPATTPAATTTASGGASGSQRTYVVHTAAWNCTCAAFAFSAFPPVVGAPSLLAPAPSGAQDPAPAAAIMDDGGADTEDEDTDGEGSTGPWQFGGFSLDGCTGAGGVPPCCKHLLACVLAERWECGLGRYVARREVGREEMAGVFADV